MRIQQHLGIVGAICSSLLLSYGAIAQTTNTTPSGIDAAEMERICTEYMNTNGTQTQQSNRPGGTTNSNSIGNSSTTTSRNTTGTGTGTSGTTTSRNTTGTGTGTSGTTTSRNTTGTGTGNSGTTTSRNTTGTGTGTSGTTTSRNTTGNTDTGTRGVESFTPEQLDRMCANFMNDSNTSGDRNTTSPKPGNTTNPNTPN